MPYKKSPPFEIVILIIFCLNLFTPNEHQEDYHIRKPSDTNFLFEIEDGNYVFVVGNLVNFETNDKIIK